MVFLAGRPSGRKRILVVDDDESLRENLADLFSAEGYDVATAPDAVEALERMASTAFDLLLTDYRTSAGSGIDLISEARRIRPGLRTILMTAFGNGFTEVEGVRRGAIGYVTKPFEVEEILDLVARILALPEE